MAALTTAYVIGDTRNRGLESYVAVSGDTIYAGSLVGTGTAAGSNDGYLKPWADAGSTSGLIAFLGVAIITEYDTDSDVDNFAVVGDGTKEVPVNTEGIIIDKLDMSSDTITIANVGMPVFCDTDNIADISETKAGSNSDPVGTLIYFRTGEICDIRLFTPTEARLMRDTDTA